MAAIALNEIGPVGRPWRSWGTPMAPNILLMCKLLFVLLLLHHFQENIRDPFVPFIRELDFFRSPPGVFEWVLKSIFYGAGTCLLFNVRVRAAAVALGVVVLLVVLASKTVFRNHIFIVGCLFLLSGLHRPGEKPWMLYLQMSLMYMGAFLNKVFQSDWWTGRFIDYWMHDHLRNPFYESLSSLFPELSFAALLSWLVIVSEFALMLFFLFRRWHVYGVSLALAMHFCFFLIVGRTPFGHFFEDVLLALMIFLGWPTTTMNVRMNRRLASAFAPVMGLFNVDQQFRFSVPVLEEGHWFEISMDKQSYSNWAGIIWNAPQKLVLVL